MRDLAATFERESVSAAPPSSASVSGASKRLSQLSLDGQGPVWLQIRRAIVQPILNGDWAPGTSIPAELALTEHFGTSRMTVVKAVQSLANEGLVERRRKTGTVVSVRAQERPVFEIWDTADIVTRNGGAYSYRLIACAFVADDPVVREVLGVGRGVQVLRILCAHLSDEKPFQLEERIVNVDAAPGITCQPLETSGPGPWLLGHVPWTQAEHTISACEADAMIVEHLQVREGSACLLVERRTWNQGVPVTVARLWHPGAQHRLTGRFEPRG